MRRFTQLTNGSSKIGHLKAGIGLHFAHHNFCRVHSTLRFAHAMAANLTDHVWGLEKLVVAL